MAIDRYPSKAGMDDGVLWIEIITSSRRSSHAGVPGRDSRKVKTRYLTVPWAVLVEFDGR